LLRGDQFTKSQRMDGAMRDEMLNGNKQGLGTHSSSILT